MLNKLKRFMKPYYQEDDEMLQEYLKEYKTPERAASMLWGELPGAITSGSVKAYGTGASSTQFFTPAQIAEFCRERASYYANRAGDTGRSLFVKVYKEPRAGGAIE